MLTRKKATEVADQIKTEVSKAGSLVTVIAVIAVVALVLSVAALTIGLRNAS